VSCLWSDQSGSMVLFIVFNLWIGPGFIFCCYSVTNKCVHFVRITVTQTPTCFGPYRPIIGECMVV